MAGERLVEILAEWLADILQGEQEETLQDVRPCLYPDRPQVIAWPFPKKSQAGGAHE